MEKIHEAAEMNDRELELASGGADSRKVTIRGKSIEQSCAVCGYDCWVENVNKRTGSERYWTCAVCEACGRPVNEVAVNTADRHVVFMDSAVRIKLPN